MICTIKCKTANRATFEKNSNPTDVAKLDRVPLPAKKTRPYYLDNSSMLANVNHPSLLFPFQN